MAEFQAISQDKFSVPELTHKCKSTGGLTKGPDRLALPSVPLAGRQ